MRDGSTHVSIRMATVVDARAIAEVHVDSWRWAYRGLIPDEYLASLSVERRTEAHRQRLVSPTEIRTWVADQDGRIVGFAVTGRSRDPDATPRTAEIGAIYLRRESVGMQIGRALLDHAVHDFWQRGFEQATLWVLDANARACRFYEKAGWIEDGAKKTEDWSGVPLVQERYRIDIRPGGDHSEASHTTRK